MAEPKRRTSFDLSLAAKKKLEGLKSDLRFADYAGVTEGAILETLIDGAKLSELKRKFEKRS